MAESGFHNSDGIEPDLTIDGLRARAPASHRVAAKAIDAGAALLLIYQDNIIGSALALLYILLGDTFGLGQSLGKKLMRLRVIHPETGLPCSMRGSVMRNLLIALPLLLLQMALLLKFLGIIIGVSYVAYEIQLLYTDAYGVRFGDAIANTEVIKLDAPISDYLRSPPSMAQVTQQPLFQERSDS